MDIVNKIENNNEDIEVLEEKIKNIELFENENELTEEEIDEYSELFSRIDIENNND